MAWNGRGRNQGGAEIQIDHYAERGIEWIGECRLTNQGEEGLCSCPWELLEIPRDDVERRDVPGDDGRRAQGGADSASSIDEVTIAGGGVRKCSSCGNFSGRGGRLGKGERLDCALTADGAGQIRREDHEHKSRKRTAKGGNCEIVSRIVLTGEGACRKGSDSRKEARKEAEDLVDGCS